MIFKYYHVCSIDEDDFQCSIISLLGPQCSLQCYSCPVPAGTTQRIINMLAQYPSYAHNACGSEKISVNCRNVFGSCTFSQIQDDINQNMPIIAGISPYGGGTSSEPAHVVLIVGYNVDIDNNYITINDPYPYAVMGVSNPYTAHAGEELLAGQYSIKYSTFIKYFSWNRTLLSIK